MVHSINYFLHYPYFLKREQVISFLARRTKKSRAKVIEAKDLYGLDLLQFRNLFALDNQIYSPKVLREWDENDHPEPEEFLHVIEKSAHQRFIAKYRFQVGPEWFSHSIAIHKVSAKHALKIQDSRLDQELYLKSQDPAQQWDLKAFCRSSDITLYVFQGKEVSATEIKNHHREMSQVMGVTDIDKKHAESLEKATE